MPVEHAVSKSQAASVCRFAILRKPRSLPDAGIEAIARRASAEPAAARRSCGSGRRSVHHLSANDRPQSLRFDYRRVSCSRFCAFDQHGVAADFVGGESGISGVWCRGGAVFDATGAGRSRLVPRASGQAARDRHRVDPSAARKVASRDEFRQDRAAVSRGGAAFVGTMTIAAKASIRASIRHPHAACRL